ncbi:MAG: HEPN domain-containing protein [Bacteroidota bacterium]|nr:HEPN domain-containing protein [Bacteroidota bacterium]
MNKAEHIAYWKETAETDWDTAIYLMDGKKYHMALFMFHLVIEKLLKANWVKDNVDNIPPYTHNLEGIYNLTELELDIHTIDYLSVINKWNTTARYPDEKRKIYKMATKEYMDEQFEKVKELRECLLKRL